MSRVPGARRRRGDLTRGEVVNAALAIIDVDGLQALTMRRLADDVGCGLMTLYTHVSDRDDLLSAIVEQVMTEIDFHYEPGDTWADVLRRAIEAYRAMAERHPAAFTLVAGSPVDRPPVSVHLARAAAVLAATGIPLDSAWAVLAIGDAFATGLLYTGAATVTADGATVQPDAQVLDIDPLTQRLRGYAGVEVLREGLETIIAGAQHTLGLPPVPVRGTTPAPVTGAAGPDDG